MAKLSVDQALSKAKFHSKKGEIEEAKKLYQAVLQAFPKNKRAQQGLAALNKPKQPNATQGPPQNIIKQLINLYNQGQFATVVEHAQALTKQYPEAFAIWNILGAANKGLGRVQAASEAFKKVTAINPNFAGGHNNFGTTLQEQGKLEEAIQAYSKALAVKPDHAEAYRNLGNSLRGVVFTQPNSDLQKTITSLLDKKTFVRPGDIANAAISLLKFEPKLRRNLKTSYVAQMGPKLLDVITDLSSLPLLLKLMSVCPIPDLDLEDLFREVRANLLLSITDLTGSAKEVEFQSALALQCFTNEYIYNQSKQEDEALSALEIKVKQTLSNGDQPSLQSILCLACYQPLNHYEWSNSLRIIDGIEDVLKRQVIEPNQEAKFKSVMPVLEKISGELSSNVRSQYEVNPYPRWVNLLLPLKPATIAKVVEETKLKLVDDTIKDVQSPNILIAGCGTGQHSIGTAARFKNSQVLAIDLSLSSLSYAKRKSVELGIQNIDYMQADILDLGKLNKQFDMVESVGVLHHMDDPIAGWRVLTDCLKPGGLMKIGLYSELARQHILQMREEISKAGIGSSDSSMKSFRTMLINSDKKYHNQILNSRDFFSLSTLRDLLFHIQEHRFTIPQIQDCLSELGLKFCGFEADKIVSHFELANSEKDDSYDLDKWQTFEVANPRIFAGMYQFWCQKMAET